MDIQGPPKTIQRRFLVIMKLSKHKNGHYGSRKIKWLSLILGSVGGWVWKTYLASRRAYYKKGKSRKMTLYSSFYSRSTPPICPPYFLRAKYVVGGLSSQSNSSYRRWRRGKKKKFVLAHAQMYSYNIGVATHTSASATAAVYCAVWCA